MKHKVRTVVEVEKRGFFGQKKKVLEKRDVWVDSKTYRQIKKNKKNKQPSFEEMLFFEDEYYDEW